MDNTVHSLMWVRFGVNPHTPHIHSFTDSPFPPPLTPPLKDDHNKGGV